MDNPHIERAEALIAKLRSQLLAARDFEVSELRPPVLAGYQQHAPDGPKIADHDYPVTVVTIAITTLSVEEHRRQLSLPPNPKHQGG